MPTVLKHGAYRIYWYSHEPNEPPHVHVDRGDYSAKFWLDPIKVAYNLGFAAHELRRIGSIIEANQPALMEAWNEYFGR